MGGYTEQRLAERTATALRERRRSAARAAAGRGRLPGARGRGPRRATAGSAQATAGCVQRPGQRPVTWTDRLDRVLTHRVWGTLSSWR